MEQTQREQLRQGARQLQRIRRLAPQQALHQLKQIDPIIFEHLTAALFAEQGFRAATTGGSGDGGVDVVLEKAGKRAIVQCKRYDGSVGEPTVRDLYGTMLHHEAKAAYLVTTGDMTQQARAWAKGKPIHLVDGLTLVGWLGTNKRGMPATWWRPRAWPRRVGIGLLLGALLAVGAFAYVRAPGAGGPGAWVRDRSLPGLGVWAQWRPSAARTPTTTTLALPVILNSAKPGAQPTAPPTVVVDPVEPPPAPVLGYTVVQSYPHDAQAFTQGLVFLDGLLYEGTGLYGQSSLRRVTLETGEVEQQVRLANRYFGEGIAVYGDRIYQLTWRSRTGFIYDRASLALLDSFAYATEGWGITHDEQHLIMSDGSDILYFWDPATLQEVRRIVVRDSDTAVERLNELEYIQGQIWANVWQTNRIAQIDPVTGRVTAWVDLTGILPASQRSGSEDVLNGIAYDAKNARIFVTGKLWPLLFEIQTKPME